MWKVEFENLKVQNELELMIKKKILTTDDQAVINAWIRQIAHHGPESIRESTRWADHALRDDWYGYRSSAFSQRGRIIYRIEDKIVKIKIARITPSHDYKRGKK